MAIKNNNLYKNVVSLYGLVLVNKNNVPNGFIMINRHIYIGNVAFNELNYNIKYLI